MKVSLRLEIKTYCSGCGYIFYVSNYLEPVVWQNDLYLIHILKDSKSALESVACQKCKEQLTGIHYHHTFEPAPKKKRRKK